MHCDPASAVVFTLDSFIYGSAFAANTQGLKYFSPSLLIALRMGFASVTCLIILIVRMIAKKEYRALVYDHSELVPLLWMTLAGLMFHGVPHIMIAFCQRWISSASVQMAQPFQTCVSAIMSHFIFKEERFTTVKFWSLILALLGVGIPAVPAFRRAGNAGSGAELGLGYFLLLAGVVFFGVATVLMKWKTPNADVTVQTLVQVSMSFIVLVIWDLIWDGPTEVLKMLRNAPLLGWFWPMLLGVLASALAGHGFVWLIPRIGAGGASFITIGQVLVGVVLGISALGEWNGYASWEIILSVFGIVCLASSIGVEFVLEKPREEEEEMPEQEEEEHVEGYDDKPIEAIPEL